MFIKPNWPAPKHIQAYTSLRPQEFNFSLLTENSESTQVAHDKLSQLLPLPSKPIWLKQVHGNTIVEALPQHAEYEADASFTREPDRICAILTADCLPVLLCDEAGTTVAAIHAGWRGLAKNILPASVQQLNIDTHRLLAWLGPAIGPEKFEVGVDVYEAFVTQSSAYQMAFKPTIPGKWLADIYELARIQLRALGLSHIYGGEYCTFTQNEYFLSARRDKGNPARMLTLIWIEKQRSL